MAECAKTYMKRPSRATDAEGGGKVYICNIILATQASAKIKTANIMEIFHPRKFSLRII